MQDQSRPAQLGSIADLEALCHDRRGKQVDLMSCHASCWRETSLLGGWIQKSWTTKHLERRDGSRKRLDRSQAGPMADSDHTGHFDQRNQNQTATNYAHQLRRSGRRLARTAF